MRKRVLVSIDDSGPATAALEYALYRFSTTDITILHVLPYAASFNDDL